MSCLICAYNCLSFMGCRDYLIRKLAFFPPPERYALEVNGVYKIEETGQELTTYIMSPFRLDSDDLQIELQDIVDTYIFKVDQLINKKLPAITTIYCKNKENSKKKKKQVILFSHGNATDMLSTRQFLIEMSHQLNCDVIGYDYTGYGDTNVNTSDLYICQNIETIYNFLIQNMGYKWYDIILYGQSLGSGPSTFLASNYYTPVLGMILHSAISSGARVIEPDTKVTIKRDFFPNIDMIEYVNTPVFVIHGIQDREIDVSMGENIYKKCKNAFPPWWVEDAGHNDIHYLYHYDYYQKLNQFVNYIQAQKEKYDKQELLNKYQARQWSADFKHIYNTKKFRLTAFEDNKNRNSRESQYKMVELK